MQDNRSQVEAQIAEAFPRFQKKIHRLSDERLLLLIGILLVLLTTWRSDPPTMNAATFQIAEAIHTVQKQTMQTVQKAADETLESAFKTYEAGKQSVHALQKKIARFFPQTEVELRGAGFAVLAILATLIPSLLALWVAKGQARNSFKEFEATHQQNQQILHCLERLVAAEENRQPLDEVKRQILQEIEDEKL
ncbi:hypothetical protein HLB42_09530 [Deinococcus sp. D7000]|nr:hypothetical protein HLB42_09530 [Deinococcus sp. D7000]